MSRSARLLQRLDVLRGDALDGPMANDPLSKATA